MSNVYHHFIGIQFTMFSPTRILCYTVSHYVLNIALEKGVAFKLMMWIELINYTITCLPEKMIVLSTHNSS